MKRYFSHLAALALALAALGPGLAQACEADDTYFHCTTEGGTKPVRLCAPAGGAVEFWLGDMVWQSDLASLRPELTDDGQAYWRTVAFTEENGNQEYRLWSAGFSDGSGELNGGYKISAEGTELDALRCDPDSLTEDLRGLAALVDTAQISP